ncbi:acetate kinase [Mollicutes bacterium LVI A0078]|nr:acetate kinase [Mollicutes bacterium LVI A0075]WOO90849.1 acetate kinase [Mollicutes bacterium LVI A0078]
MRKTLVINAGSSSLKYKLFGMPDYIEIAEGIIERIGLEMGIVSIKVDGNKIEKEMPIENHEVGIKAMLDLLEENNVIENYEEITKVGHRVVQGGEVFQESVLVGEDELAKIIDLAKLAPLHNIPNSVGIEVFSKLIPNAQNIAVFDTTFHTTMEEDAYLYPVPYEWYEKFGVRRYGAHGTSHKFIAERVEELEGKGQKLINLHLGNGASITAINDGKCVTTSMGLTPLGGIMMGTRSGDLDPSILNYVSEQTGMDVAAINNALNKESGMLGLSGGISSDFRDIKAAYDAGNEAAIRTLEIYANRIAETVASYIMHLGGLDTMVFTAGVGENAALVREKVCQRLAPFGIDLDLEANDCFSQEKVISTDTSNVKVYIIPTEEELMIAKEAELF